MRLRGIERSLLLHEYRNSDFMTFRAVGNLNLILVAIEFVCGTCRIPLLILLTPVRSRDCPKVPNLLSSLR